MKTQSIYARKFDSSCTSWEENREWNRMYLKATENYFNDILKNRGYVFLRDIYEYLGIPANRTSLVVGWSSKSTCSDGYIEFDLENVGETDYSVDFNVDGDIAVLFED